MKRFLLLTLPFLWGQLLSVSVAGEPVRQDVPGLFPIRIAHGKFVDAKGNLFAPRGFNYIRLFPGRSHDTFDPDHYDSAAVERALQRWQEDGFNVVRVFLNSAAHLPGSLAKKGVRGLVRSYVTNVADFLVRSRGHGIDVILCTESFPRVAPYTDGLQPLPLTLSPANAEYLDAGHVEAKVRFLKDLILELKAAQPACLDAVLSYDLQNEFCFQCSAPFTLESGRITAPNGKTYMLPAQRQELADDAAVHFVDRMADAIHQVHPGALVGADVFTCAAVGRPGPGDFSVKKAQWQNRVPFRPLALLRSHADYLDLHFYPANEKELDRDLASVEFDSVRQRAKELGKPLVAGEFGAFKKVFPDVVPAAEWMRKLSQAFRNRGFAGWLYWTFDTHEQGDELWHACESGFVIYRRLGAAE